MLVFIRPVTSPVITINLLLDLFNILFYSFVRLSFSIFLHGILVHRQRTQHLVHLLVSALLENLLLLFLLLLLLLNDFRFRHINLDFHPLLRIQT